MFCVNNLFIVQNIQGVISDRSSRSRRCSCVLDQPIGDSIIYLVIFVTIALPMLIILLCINIYGF